MEHSAGDGRDCACHAQAGPRWAGAPACSVGGVTGSHPVTPPPVTHSQPPLPGTQKAGVTNPERRKGKGRAPLGCRVHGERALQGPEARLPGVALRHPVAMVVHSSTSPAAPHCPAPHSSACFHHRKFWSQEAGNEGQRVTETRPPTESSTAMGAGVRSSRRATTGMGRDCQKRVTLEELWFQMTLQGSYRLSWAGQCPPPKGTALREPQNGACIGDRIIADVTASYEDVTRGQWALTPTGVLRREKAEAREVSTSPRPPRTNGCHQRLAGRTDPEGLGRGPCTQADGGFPTSRP